jgi:tetratricopeptide (TPR) repeat protein
MTPERWRATEKLFDEVAELTMEERSRVLAGVDPELRGELEPILAAADQQRRESGNTGIATVRAAIEEGREMFLPERFGPYRVTGLAGRGGMGAVYRAVRDDGAFDHPNIVRLLDGGETEAGASYIVMEFVAGVPLLEYCSGENLSTTARLRLFLDICSAVQYAHQKLIVHRDLKPGNIRVTGGVPKLLDFGIAKLLDPSAGGAVTAMRAMTPDYASPEQARGQSVSAASDVYSLGLVLYVMLTGRRPYEVPATPPSEVERMICEATPPPAGISADIDNILTMALRKEPERRYPTAREFAEDVERALSNRPVRARPDTVVYRAGRFFRRNRTFVTAVAIVAAALIGGIVATEREARRAQRHFEDVRHLADAFLMDVNARLPGASTQAREEIVNTSLDYLRKLSAEGVDNGPLRSDLAAAYQTVGHIQSQSLGKNEEARKSYQTAIELAKGLGDSGNPPAAAKALASAYLGMLDIEFLHGNSGRAMEYGRKALELASDAERHNDWGRDFLVTAYTRIGRPFLEVGQPSQALAADRNGLRLAEEQGLRKQTDDRGGAGARALRDAEGSRRPGLCA